MNESALSYWRHTGFTRNDVDAVCRQLENALAARFDFSPNKAVTMTVSQLVGSTRQGHFPVCLKLVQKIVESWPEPSPTGSFILMLEDGMWDVSSPLSRKAPILAFGKRIDDPYTMVIPDPAFVGARGYVKELGVIDDIEGCLSWQLKKPTVFWRGAGSGSGMQGADWINCPRIQLALASKRIDNPQILNAFISTVIDYGDCPATREIPRLDIVREHVPFVDFLTYRYLIDVDGEHCAWKSLFLKLSSKSLVLKMQSELRQWYHERILPWIHYVPLRRDLSDLEDIIKWLHAHDEQCRYIALAGNEIMKTIDYDSAFQEVSELMAALLRCCKKEVSA